MQRYVCGRAPITKSNITPMIGLPGNEDFQSVWDSEMIFSQRCGVKLENWAKVKWVGGL